MESTLFLRAMGVHAKITRKSEGNMLHDRVEAILFHSCAQTTVYLTYSVVGTTVLYSRVTSRVMNGILEEKSARAISTKGITRGE